MMMRLIRLICGLFLSACFDQFWLPCSQGLCACTPLHWQGANHKTIKKQFHEHLLFHQTKVKRHSQRWYYKVDNEVVRKRKKERRCRLVGKLVFVDDDLASLEVCVVEGFCSRVSAMKEAARTRHHREIPMAFWASAAVSNRTVP